MTNTEIITLALLILIAAETTYMVYQSRRQTAHSKRTSIYVDTSVLMDGRILPIAEAGFIPGVLVIPRSVVGELQLLADGGDSEKRERARRGLDLINELQACERVNVELLQDGSRAHEGVDERLLTLAKKRGGLLCTIDFNLNKVAQVENIEVLNINELAQKLRMSYLPGDTVRLQLTTHGSDSHQAVGHLGDGTMVVVEHAKTYIGREVDVEVIRNLQTAAGRMMFARLSGTKAVSATKKTASPASRGRRKVEPKPAAPAKPRAAKAAQTAEVPRDARKQSRRPMQSRESHEDAVIALANK